MAADTYLTVNIYSTDGSGILWTDSWYCELANASVTMAINAQGKITFTPGTGTESPDIVTYTPTVTAMGYASSPNSKDVAYSVSSSTVIKATQTQTGRDKTINMYIITNAYYFENKPFDALTNLRITNDLAKTRVNNSLNPCYGASIDKYKISNRTTPSADWKNAFYEFFNPGAGGSTHSYWHNLNRNCVILPYQVNGNPIKLMKNGTVPIPGTVSIEQNKPSVINSSRKIIDVIEADETDTKYRILWTDKAYYWEYPNGSPPESTAFPTNKDNPISIIVVEKKIGDSYEFYKCYTALQPTPSGYAREFCQSETRYGNAVKCSLYNTVFSDFGYAPRVIAFAACGGGGGGSDRVSSNYGAGGGGGYCAFAADLYVNETERSYIEVKLGTYGRVKVSGDDGGNGGNTSIEFYVFNSNTNPHTSRYGIVNCFGGKGGKSKTGGAGGLYSYTKLGGINDTFTVFGGYNGMQGGGASTGASGERSAFNVTTDIGIPFVLSVPTYPGSSRWSNSCGGDSLGPGGDAPKCGYLGGGGGSDNSNPGTGGRGAIILFY